MASPTVFIVDDDEAVRDSIAELVTSIGLESARYGSAREYLEAYDPEAPGCLILDVRMAHMSGPALQDKLSAMGATRPIVFISGHADIPVAIKAVKAGAVDFVQKPYRDQRLLDAINEALARDAEIRDATRRDDGFARRLTTLTPREREVLDLVLKGMPTKAIARSLSISPRTIEVHRSRILEKMQVRTVPELIHLAKK